MTIIIVASCTTIARLRCAQMKFSPGVVPQWPSSRGLMCSGRSGSVSSGLSIGRSGPPTGSWRPASRFQRLASSSVSAAGFNGSRHAWCPLPKRASAEPSTPATTSSCPLAIVVPPLVSAAPSVAGLAAN